MTLEDKLKELRVRYLNEPEHRAAIEWQAKLIKKAIGRYRPSDKTAAELSKEEITDIFKEIKTDTV